jgi:tetratricopeptide (TPR) repeat protein
MDVERRREVEEVYRAARRQQPGQVHVFLAEACGADEELRSEVEALLNQPFWGALTGSPNEALSAQPSGALTIAPACFQPANIGHYRILRLLGEGGMGTVYEAEQEHPCRIVALKVIKPGLINSELLRRFEHEARALGRLQHPGIAQIYEAGMEETGFGRQPYFAMEFIRGRLLLDYASQQHLSTRERLDLMVRVCEAVHHAHQRGLIHRDLKPCNILVNETGQPKILDFGVARATDSDAQATRQTDLGQLVGTLAYMSPEQVLGDPLELDTRSDVYALGVILYELLAGCMPYSISEKLHEVVRVIREEEPVPLSSINRIYRGDVETIVAKALEKDKTRRYSSAADLGADIQHFLHDEPILARPASTIYQLRKFARRRRALVTGAFTVLVVLVAGTVASTWQAARATQERNRAVAEKRRADTEAATAKAINDFLQNDLLARASANVQAGPGAKPDPGLKVRTALDRAAARIGDKFEKQPLVEASIRQTIGKTYFDLGLFSEAQPQFERALQLLRRAAGETHPDALRIMNELALLYLRQGKHTQAEPLFKEVLMGQSRGLGEAAPDTLDTINNLAVLYRHEGKYAEAEPLSVKAVVISRRVLGEESTGSLDTMNNLALVYLYEGKYAQAEPLFIKVLDIGRRQAGEEHPDTLVSMNNLALVYLYEGKDSLAEPLFLKVLKVRQRVLGGEHPNTLRSMNNLALSYLDQGEYTNAEPLFDRAFNVQRRVLGTEHPDTLTYASNLALLYLRQTRYTMAETLFLKILDARRRLLGPEHPATANVLASLANVRLRRHKYAQAEPLLREALGIQEKKNPDSWEQFNSRSMLGHSLAGQEKYGEAEALLLSSYEGLLKRKATIPSYNRVAVEEAGERIVQLYQHWHKPEKAVAWREKLRARLTSAPFQP